MLKFIKDLPGFTYWVVISPFIVTAQFIKDLFTQDWSLSAKE